MEHFFEVLFAHGSNPILKSKPCNTWVLNKNKKNPKTLLYTHFFFQV